MQTVDAGRAELRELNELSTGRLESRIGELRHEIRADIANLRAELQGEISVTREGLKGIEATIDRRFGDLLKWSFLFWCGAVAAALLGRR